MLVANSGSKSFLNSSALDQSGDSRYQAEYGVSQAEKKMQEQIKL
jgi:hypothetical protein